MGKIIRVQPKISVFSFPGSVKFAIDSTYEILDRSVYEKSITNYGVSTSLVFETGDYLSVADSDDWDFSADFSIDFKIKFNAYGSYIGIISTASDGNSNGGFMLEFGSARGFVFFNNAASLLEDNLSDIRGLSISTWYHFGISRVGTDLKIFKDGSQIGGSTSSATINGGSNALMIGRYSHANYNFMLNGEIFYLRINKGNALDFPALWAANKLNNLEDAY